jgi:K+/H+ antiporter YhaU regulatory subunit KhtT
MGTNMTIVDDRPVVDRLPGVGPRYEIGTIDGRRLTVVIDRQGDRHISLRPDGPADDPGASAVISARQSSLLALILTGILEMAEAELPVEGRRR